LTGRAVRAAELASALTADAMALEERALDAIATGVPEITLPSWRPLPELPEE